MGALGIHCELVWHLRFGLLQRGVNWALRLADLYLPLMCCCFRQNHWLEVQLLRLKICKDIVLLGLMAHEDRIELEALLQRILG